MRCLLPSRVFLQAVSTCLYVVTLVVCVPTVTGLKFLFSQLKTKKAVVMS